jgi:1,2-diacylglycerol 3-alpha-glucosyltransferase
MRIGIFSESYEPIINGVTVCVQTLRDELTSQGHQVYIFSPGYAGFVDPYDKVFRFPSQRTYVARDYPLPIPFSPHIKRVFDGLDLDIVHTQTPFMLGILGARWAKRRGIPVVSTNHTLYVNYAHYARFVPKAFTKQLVVFLMRQYYNRCDGVIAPSELAKDVLQSYGVQTRVEVIAGGVTNGMGASGSSGFRERLAVSPETKLLLYVGRLAREKNLSMLFAAFRLIADRIPDSRLVVIGGGPYERELRSEAVRNGVRDKVILMGTMPRSELGGVYASADVFLWPSETETQGLAVCEALSAGLPCVAVRAGGTPECVEEGVDSFLTENDAQAFADSAVTLLSDDAMRRSMSAAALRNAEKFSAPEMAAKFYRFYCSIIEDYKRGTH